MECRRIAISFMGLLVALAAQAGTLLKVGAGDSGLSGQPLTLDGKFVGLVGDTILIEKPSSQLAVRLPEGFSATMTLQLASSTLTIIALASGSGRAEMDVFGTQAPRQTSHDD
jgi:hypothetical protein